MSRPELGTLLRHIQHLAGPCAPAEVSDRELLTRFAARREEAAFTALVQRHGPLVLNVCRRLLRQEQDAEDVFQATFLVLARKACSVRWRESVAPWLHAVAYRLALKARAESVRRRRQEREAVKERPATDAGDLSWREATALLEEELGRLPERYRAPLLLCCWEGKARDEAARLLGWTVGAVKGRLERGRELLRQRLARRGVLLSAGLLAVGLARGGVPAALAGVTVRLALGGGAEVVPPAVAALAGAGLSAARAKIVGAVLAVLLLAAGAGVWTQTERMGRPVEEARADEAPAPPAPQEVAGEQPAAAPPAPAEKAPEAKPPEEAPPEEKPPVPLPWPRKDVEGNALPAGVAQRFGTTRLRSGSPVQMVALSSDGKLLATASGAKKGSVQVWDTATGKELHRLDAEVTSLAFSPDGDLLVAWAVGERTPGTGPHFWNTKTGALSKWIPRNGMTKARLLVFSADGRRLWAFGGGAAAMWEFGAKDKHKPQLELRDGFERAEAVVAGQAQKTKFVAVATPGEILYLNEAGKELARDRVPRDVLTTLACSENYLAAGTKQGGIYLRHLAAGWAKPLHVWHDPGGMICGLALAGSGDDLRLTSVSAGAKGIEVRVWDPKTAKELAQVRLDGSPKYDPRGTGPKVSLSADGKRVAVVDGRWHHARLWDAATGKELLVHGAAGKEKFAPRGHDGSVSQVAFLPDGRTVASAGADGLLLWTIGSDASPRRFAGTGRPAGQVAMSRDGKTVAASTLLNGIELWNADSDKGVREIILGEAISPLALSPDGRSLAFGGTAVRLMRLRDGSIHPLADETISTAKLAFSPDGKLLAVDERKGDGDTIGLWDVAGAKKLRTLAGPPGTWIDSLVFDPDGRTLAVAGQRSDTVTLYDVAAGRALRRCRRAEATVHCLTFARGGRLLVAGNEDGLTVWETASGAEVLHLTGHTGLVTSVAASPDGNRLVTGGADTTVLLWDLAAAWKETAPKPPKGKEPPTPEDLWHDLGHNAQAAYRAVWALAAEPGKVLPLMKKELAPLGTPAKRDEISRLVADLDDADPKVRARAIQRLRRMGPPAEPALRKALEGAASDKLRARLRALLADLEGEDQFTPDQHALHASRVVDLLELIGTAEARKLLEALARDGATWALQQEAKAALARRPPPRPPAP